MSDSAFAIAFTPLLPWPAIVVLGGLALAFGALALWRRRRAGGWRLAAATLLVLALANPGIQREQRAPRPDVTLLVIDRSQSQTLADRPARTTAAVTALRTRLADMEDMLVREITVAPRTASAGAPAATAGDGTRLFGALAEGLAEIPRRRLAGVVVVSDGQVHDPPPALAGEAPLHVLLTGRRDERDRYLEVRKAPRFALVDQESALTVHIHDRQVAAGTPLDVTVTVDASAPRRLRLPANQDVDIPLTIGHAGANIVAVTVAAGADELTLVNNRAVRTVNGVRDRLRVLLVSGLPHPGERAWRDVLKSDPSVDLVHFTILRPREKQDGTPIRELALIAFPYRQLFEQKLDQFDLVILDRYHRRGLLPRAYFRNIAEYVRGGGAVLEASGPQFAGPLSLDRTALGAVLPATPSGEIVERPFRPRLTETGRRHPVTGDLPGGGGDGKAARWGRWLRQIDARATRGATVLSGADGRPLMVLDRVEEGRVAHILSDQLWLWTRAFDGGGPGLELLRRTVHWLMKEPELEEDALVAKVREGRLEIRRRSLTDAAGPVTVTVPNGDTRQVTLTQTAQGRAAATTAIEGAGVYRVEDDRRAILVAVGAVEGPEMADVRTTAAVLAPVAEARGGGVFWLPRDGLPRLRRTDPDDRQSGAGWIGLRANRDYVVTGQRDGPLLPAPLALVLVLAVLVIAWRQESR